jgi:hypothetical protein
MIGEGQGRRLARRAAGAVITALAALPLAACGDEKTSSGKAASSPEAAERASFSCDPAEANRPDKPREEVAGTIAPAVPQRSCTLPQRGCVDVTGIQGRVAPPEPGIDISRVTKNAIEVAYDLGSDLDGCEPRQMLVTVQTTSSGLPPYGADYPVSGPTGTLQVERKQLPGNVDYGPPDLLVVSSTAENGLRSELASVGLPPPEGERALTDAERRQIAARREACRADIDDRTSCEMGGAHPVSGPVTAATTAELTRSVRQTLEGTAGANVELIRLRCFNGTRCEAAFAFSDYPLEMTYRVEALKAVPTCWELTAFRVTRPVPQLGNFAAPLPSRGCTDR